MTKNPTFLYTFKRIEKMILKRYLLIHVQSSMCNRKKSDYIGSISFTIGEIRKTSSVINAEI